MKPQSALLKPARARLGSSELGQAFLSKADLGAVLNTLFDGVIMVDAFGTISMFNSAAETIFGYTAQEILGRKLKTLLAEPFASDYEIRLRDVGAAGGRALLGVDCEIVGRRKDGSPFPMELGINEMRAGGVAMYVATLRDITRQREAVREQAHMAAIVQSTSDAIISKTLDGIITSWNPAAEFLLGYKEQEVLGKPITILFPSEYREDEKHILEEVRAGRHVKVYETVRVGKGGRLINVSVSISPIYNGEGVIIGASKVMRDITQQKVSEEGMAELLSALRRSNQELDDFAYIASHDLKEPLRGLSNNAIFLREDCEGKLDAQAEKRIGRMMFLCERMERLVNDLLNFSRLGRQQLAVQPTDLNEVVRDITAMMETTLAEAGATVSMPAPLPTIICDRTRITEALRNLITNAVKYNDKAHKRIEIGSTELQGERVFYVKDNGIGIAAAQHDEVFRIFRRLNDEDAAAQGSGVGLTFVKKIIERHHGRIWIESVVGEGTVFYFTIHGM